MRPAGSDHRVPALAAFILATLVAGGCTVAPSPTPSQIVCGPLAVDDCAAAIAVAKTALGVGVVPSSIRVAAPAPDHSCPPSGGMAGSHACAVIVVLATANGNVDVGLVRTVSGGWVDAATIR